jgi:hypothetical protein
MDIVSTVMHENNYLINPIKAIIDALQEFKEEDQIFTIRKNILE